jgi:hypothetical protein
MHTLLLTPFFLAPLAPREPMPAQDPPGVEEPLDSAALAAGARPTWELALSAYFVDPPGEDGYTTTILYADRGPLHLEARYNYEDLNTVSLFAGWTFEVGDEVHAALTPMLGGVFGDTNGVAPGLLVDADWRRLNFYTEAEYVLDTDDSDDNYFYSWSTLMWQFTEVFAAGIVSERTKIFDTNRNLQVGFALQVTPGPIGVSLYAYNPGSDVDYTMLSVDFSF